MKNEERSSSFFLWVEIHFVKKLGLKELCDADLKSLTKLVNDSKFYRIVGTVDDVADGGFRYTAFDKKLILGHFMFTQQFLKPDADSLIQLQLNHHTFFVLCFII